MKLFRYDVSFWDTTKDEMAKDSGVACGQTAGEATDAIIKAYGPEEVDSITISMCADCILSVDELNFMNS